MTYYAGYLFQNGLTFVVDREGNQEELCQEVRIINIVENIDEPEVGVVVTVEITKSDGTKPTYTVSRQSIVESPISALSKYGLTLAKIKEYDITLSEILMDTERQATKTYTHKRLGFHEFRGKMCYFAHRAMFAPITCRYYNDKLKPKGTFEAWREGMLPFLEEKPELQLALAMGASAPIVALLMMAGVVKESCLFGLIGSSSSGKTSALEACCSLNSKPTLQGGLDSFLGTENGLYGALSNKVGYPHFCDESSAQSWDFTRAIYKIALSTEGVKCSPDGSPKTPRVWQTTFVYTGEASLFNQTNDNLGLYARLIEFNFVWTKDSASADALQRHVSQQYGTAWPVYIEALKKFKRKDLIEQYDQRVEELTNMFAPASGVCARIVKKLAILLLSAEMLSFALELPLDRTAVVELLQVTYQRSIPNVDRINAMYSALLLYITNNRNSFPTKGSNHLDQVSACEGIIDVHNYRRCVWLPFNFFDEFLKEKHQLSYSKELMDIMKERHMAAYFSDRYRKNHDYFGIEHLSVCIYLNADPSVKEAKKKKAAVKHSSMVHKNSKIDELLDPEE